jgi:AcrR family transcriptional regulator
MDKKSKMYEKRVDKPITDGKDRRSQRSEQVLINALLELMTEKTYDAITIKEIVEKANVGRSTFYAHYQTKDDLVKSGFERLLDEMLNHVVLSKNGHGLIVDITMFFLHTKGHFHLYKNLMWGTGLKILTIDEHNIFSEKLLQRLLQLFHGEDKIIVPLDVVCISFSGSLLILLKWWLDNKMPYSPQRMNEIFQILVMPGINSALEIKNKSE